MLRRLLVVCLLAGCVFAWATADALARQSPAGPPAVGRAGALGGTVFGPDAARLPGVTVAVTNLERDGEVRVVSGEHGGYHVSNLAPGRYRVRADLAGFLPTVAEAVEVVGGATTILDLRLRMETLEETVTVVGKATRDSLEASSILESGARDIGEALSGVAGLTRVRKAAIANDIVLRGYQGDNVSVLIDGMRLYGACPGHMDRTAFHVDFAEVERVEIAKGPFDLRNQGSLGGAVNIVTKRPAEGFHVTPNLSVGSYGYVNPSVTASLGTRRLAMLVGYSYRASNPYTDGRGRSMLEVTNFNQAAYGLNAFEINTGWARLDLAPVEGQAGQISYTRQRTGNVLYPYMRMDAVYDNADRVNATWDASTGWGPLHAVRAQGYFSRVRHLMTDEFRTSSANMPRAYSMGTLAGTETQGGKFETMWMQGLAGVEVYRRNWVTESWTAMNQFAPRFPMPDVWITAGGAYVEHSLRRSRFTVDLGARLDHASSRADAAKANTDLYFAYHDTRATSAVDTQPSAKARVTWQAASAVTLAGGIGRTVRLPDPQERFYAMASMGSDWVGDPGLEPTADAGVDLSLTVRRPRVSVTATLFRDDLDNFVTVYDQARINLPRAAAVPGMGSSSMGTTTMPPVTMAARSYANVGATMRGAEIEAVVSLSDHLFLAGDVAGVRGRQDADPAAGISSGNIAEIRPVRSRLALRYDARQQRGGLYAEIEGVYAAAQDHVNSDVREQATPGYGVANLRIGGLFGPARVTIGVVNLFDRAYAEHLSYQRDPFRSGVKVYEPGRNVYTQIQLRF